MMLSLILLTLSVKVFALNYQKFDLQNHELDIPTYAANLVDQLINRRGVRKEVFVVVNQEPIVDQFLQQITTPDVVFTVVTWQLFNRYDFEGYGAVAAYTFNAPVMVLFEGCRLEVLLKIFFLLFVDVLINTFQGVSSTIFDIFNQPGTKAGFKIILIVSHFKVESVPANMTQIIRKSFIKYHDTVVLFKLGSKLQVFLYQYNEASTFNVTGEKNAENIFKRRRNHLQISQKDDPPRSQVIGGKVTGMDGLYLENYVSYMRVNYTIVSPEYELQHFNSDLSFNVKDFHYINMDSSALFYINQFWRQCILVPKAEAESIIDALITIMAPNAILVMLLANLLFGIFFYLVLQLRPQLRIKATDAFFVLLRTAITNSVNRRMRTPFERISLTAHIVFSFLVLNATLCFMKQFLVSPRHNDINTIDHLNRTDLKIIGSDVEKYLASKWFDQAFADKIIPVHNGFRQPINRSFAHILPNDFVDQYVHSNANYVRGVQQMHKMKQHISEYYRGYSGKIDDYYMETMHFYLSAIEESGIRQHWKWVVRGNSRDPVEKKCDKVAITMQQMRKLFLALVIGYGLAFLVFLGELAVGHCRYQ
jgi:hypothetical protein